MSTDRQMDAARATAAREAASRATPYPRPVVEMSNWEIFKFAFSKENPLHVENRRWGGARKRAQAPRAGALAATRAARRR